MDWIFVFLQNSYVETLCPKWRYGDEDLLEVIRVKRGHKCGTLTMGLVHLWEETPEMLLSFSLSSQEDSSHRELNYMASSSGLHSLQNCERTNLQLSCLSTVFYYGSLSWLACSTTLHTSCHRDWCSIFQHMMSLFSSSSVDSECLPFTQFIQIL